MGRNRNKNESNEQGRGVRRSFLFVLALIHPIGLVLASLIPSFHILIPYLIEQSDSGLLRLNLDDIIPFLIWRPFPDSTVRHLCPFTSRCRPILGAYVCYRLIPIWTFVSSDRDTPVCYRLVPSKFECLCLPTLLFVTGWYRPILNTRVCTIQFR